jgi:hypothetical protein
MAYDYFGASVFHAVVRMLNDGEQVSHETLFRLVLERLTDRSTWLRDEIHRQAARLASVANGTRATVIGTRDLSKFSVHDPENNPAGELGPGGLLDGTTLSLGEDTAAAEVVQFNAPITAADIAAQIAAGAPTNKGVFLDDGGRLVLSSKTVGGGSTLAVSGSATAPLGLPVGTATGKGTVDDGASRVGFLGHGAVPTGTVRSALVQMIDAVATLVAKKASLEGGTFTGPVTFEAPVRFNSGFSDTAFFVAPDENAVIEPEKASLVLIPHLPKKSRSYQLAEPVGGRRRVRFVRFATSQHSAMIRRTSDGQHLATLPPNGIAWVDIEHVDDGSGAKWHPTAWAGNLLDVAWNSVE